MAPYSKESLQREIYYLAVFRRFVYITKSLILCETKFCTRRRSFKKNSRAFFKRKELNKRRHSKHAWNSFRKKFQNGIIGWVKKEAKAEKGHSVPSRTPSCTSFLEQAWEALGEQLRSTKPNAGCENPSVMQKKLAGRSHSNPLRQEADLILKSCEKRVDLILRNAQSSSQKLQVFPELRLLTSSRCSWPPAELQRNHYSWNSPKRSWTCWTP